jgi:hypothetical protein
MPADRLAARPPHHTTLTVLARDVRVAREEVGQLRRGRIMHDRLLAARQSLLVAMDSYAAELTARGLPIPPGLRDDLRLQHSIRRLRDTPRSAIQARGPARSASG